MDKSVRKCEICATVGKVIDVRHRHDMTVRRLECGQGHRFTTVELRPPTSATGRALTGRVYA